MEGWYFEWRDVREMGDILSAALYPRRNGFVELVFSMADRGRKHGDEQVKYVCCLLL